MRHSIKVFATAVLGVLASVTPALAHHGASVAYDVSKPVSLKATVTEFRWTNPHAELYFDAQNKAGNVVHWGGELSSPASLARCGWTRNVLQPGEQITVTFARSRVTTNFVFIEKVLLGDGRALAANQVLKPLH